MNKLWEAYETIENIYQRLEEEFAPRVAYEAIDDMLAPEGTVSGMDGPFQVFEDELHLTVEWCTAHSFDLTRKIQTYLV